MVDEKLEQKLTSSMENVKSIREKLGLSIEDASHFVDKQKALWKKPPNHVSGPSKYKSRKIKDIAKTTIQSYRPLSIKHEDSVPFELLFAQLNDKGKVSNDDFLAQARLALQTSGVEDYDQTSSRSAIPISRMYRLFYTGYLELENGFIRTSDGSFYIACIADLGVCTGEMFEWWLLFCDSAERFRWSHPEHNLSLQWDAQFYAKQAIDRHEGYHIGHKMQIRLMVDFIEYEFEVEFIDPREYVRMHEYENEEAKVTAFIVARINMKILGVFVYIATIAIMVRSTEGINEIRVRVWLGRKTIVRSKSRAHSIFATLANTTAGRCFFYRESHAKAIHDYVNESIFCIRTFLPGLFSQRVRFYKMNMIPGQYEAEYKDPDSISETSGAHSGSLTDGESKKSHGFRISEYGNGHKYDIERRASLYHLPKLHKPVNVVNKEYLQEMIATQATKTSKERKEGQELESPVDALQGNMKTPQGKLPEDTSTVPNDPAWVLGDVAKSSITAAAQISSDVSKTAKDLHDQAMKKMMKTLKGDRINVPHGAGQQSLMELRIVENMAMKKAAAMDKQVEMENGKADEGDNVSKEQWSFSSLFGSNYSKLDKQNEAKPTGICIHERQELVCVLCKKDKLKALGRYDVCSETDDVESANHTVEGAVNVNVDGKEVGVSAAVHGVKKHSRAESSAMNDSDVDVQLETRVGTRLEDVSTDLAGEVKEGSGMETDPFKEHIPHPLNPKIPQGRKVGKFKIHKKVKEGEDGEEKEILKIHHRRAVREREAPEILEGVLDKMTHRLFGNTFQKNFFRVNIEKRCIEYAKSMNILEGKREGVTPGSIVFAAIIEIVIDESCPEHFSILVPNGDEVFTYQLRASDDKEAQRWKTGLEQWVDYFKYLDSKKEVWIRGGAISK